MKKILVIAIMAMMAVGLYAEGPARVPAYRGLLKHEQPNGDTLRLYLHGDEHIHWMTTQDGWRIVHGKKKWLQYAKRNRKGEIVRSCRKAHNEEDRSRCEKKWLDKHGINQRRQE